MLSKNERNNEKIAESGRFDSLEECKSYICYLFNLGLSTGDVIGKVKEMTWNFPEAKYLKDNISSLMVLKTQKDLRAVNGSFVRFYEEEYKVLRSLPSDLSRKFLYAALLYAKQNYHQSGWIKYNRELYFKIWDIKKLTERDKVNAVNYCYNQGLIDFRVVGSKIPLTCYKVNFMLFDGSLLRELAEEKDWVAYYNELFKE